MKGLSGVYWELRTARNRASDTPHEVKRRVYLGSVGCSGNCVVPIVSQKAVPSLPVLYLTACAHLTF